MSKMCETVKKTWIVPSVKCAKQWVDMKEEVECRAVNAWIRKCVGK